MIDYKAEYLKWLRSDAITEDERAELAAIADDDKEIESRFYGPLEFGTAGLRGTMKMGLHQMNIYVIRWATQGFANVICAEGSAAMDKGVAICMDCRHHSMEFARAPPRSALLTASMCGFLSPCAPLRSLALPCGTTAARRASTSPPATTPRSIMATRSTGPTAPSCPPARRCHRPRAGEDRHLHRRKDHAL